MSILSAPHFQNAEKAREFLENLRWGGEPICPHCGTIGGSYATKKAGRYRCGSKDCRKDFTVTTKSVMESSHIPLHKWLQGFHLMASSKKGMSAHQMHRTMQITYKSAWFMWHRIREAMRTGGFEPLGGAGKVVEADETFIGSVQGEGGKEAARARRKARQGGWAHKNVVVTLVERGGSARSFHVDSTTVAAVVPIVRENIARETALMTDEANQYKRVGKEFASHEAVEHQKHEYVRDEGRIHTNTVEGFYSIFKRGMKGVYQHCSEKHLHRYLAEFDFRYSNRVRLGIDDTERARLIAKGAENKRLMYRQPRAKIA